MGQELRLTIERIPETAANSNLQQKAKKPEWDKIRNAAYAESDYRCGICGDDEARLECHEIFEYDDQKHIQKLIGFIALCPSCHRVKHTGWPILPKRDPRKLYDEGMSPDEISQLHREDIVRHPLKVNGCSREVWERHKKAARNKWRKRSKVDWTTDFGEWSHLVESD